MSRLEGKHGVVDTVENHGQLFVQGVRRSGRKGVGGVGLGKSFHVRMVACEAGADGSSGG